MPNTLRAHIPWMSDGQNLQAVINPPMCIFFCIKLMTVMYINMVTDFSMYPVTMDLPFHRYEYNEIFVDFEIGVKCKPKFL